MMRLIPAISMALLSACVPQPTYYPATSLKPEPIYHYTAPAPPTRRLSPKDRQKLRDIREELRQMRQYLGDTLNAAPGE